MPRTPEGPTKSPETSRETTMEQKVEFLRRDVATACELVQSPDVRESVRSYAAERLAELNNWIDLVRDEEYGGDYMPKQVFVSYSHKNFDLANAVTQGFRDRGVRYWRDVEKIASGNKIEEKIESGDLDNPDDAKPVSTFGVEIQRKGIPGSSELVVLLTKEAAGRFGEIKKEIMGAGGGLVPVIPVLVGNEEEREYIRETLKRENVDWILNNPSNQLIVEDPAAKDEIAAAILSQIQQRAELKEFSPDEQQQARGATGKKRPSFSSPEDQKSRAIIRGVANDARSGSSWQLFQIIDHAIPNMARGIRDENTSLSEKTLSQLAEIQASINRGLDAWFSQFQPRAVYLTAPNPEMATQLQKEMADLGIGISTGEAFGTYRTDKYGRGPHNRHKQESRFHVAVLSDTLLQNGLSEEMQKQIASYLRIVKDDPSGTDIVPIYVGASDFGQIRRQLEACGLGELVDYMAIVADKNASPKAMAKGALEFMRRSERARRAPNMYRKNYNSPLNDLVSVHVP